MNSSLGKPLGSILVIILSFTILKGEIISESSLESSTLEPSGNVQEGINNVATDDQLIVLPPEDSSPVTVTKSSSETTDAISEVNAASKEEIRELLNLIQGLRRDHEEYDKNVSELVSNNMALISRILALESRVRSMEGLLLSISNDQRFHHPTMEVQYVDMQIVQWEEALKGRLQSSAIPFQAGFAIGAISSWEFSLATENGAVTVNLLLIEEKYGKGALFAGFTAYVLDSEGNVFSQANALPVNFLDGNGRNLHLPNVISLKDIQNSSNLLSEGDVFKIRLRLELIGVGHKLYPDFPRRAEPPAKDAQTVVFDVENIFAKLGQQNDQSSSNGVAAKPLAFTKFRLKHEAWDLETEWSAELHRDNISGKDLSLHLILEKCDWSELYASIIVEVWDLLNKRLVLTQGTPINEFTKDRINIDPLVLLSQLRGNPYEDEDDLTLRFKVQLTVYGRNARYYADV